MGRPQISRRILRGSRVEASRAGITAIAFIHAPPDCSSEIIAESCTKNNPLKMSSRFLATSPRRPAFH
jgi:hypothetical protein